MEPFDWKKDARRQASARYQAKHPDRVKKWRDANKDRARGHRLKRDYGITLEEFNALFTSQGNVCAVCQSDQPQCTSGWNVDHDHDTGKVRGILCGHCNRMLGQARDSITTLQAGIAYLQRFGVTK